MEIEKQQTNAMKAQEVEHRVRQMSGKNNQTAATYRSNNNKRGNTMPPSYAMNSEYESAISNASDEASGRLQEQYDAMDLQKSKNRQMMKQRLRATGSDAGVPGLNFGDAASDAYHVIKTGLEVGVGTGRVAFSVGRAIYNFTNSFGGTSQVGGSSGSGQAQPGSSTDTTNTYPSVTRRLNKKTTPKEAVMPYPFTSAPTASSSSTTTPTAIRRRITGKQAPK
jgi:hypothetical protein